LDPRGNAQRTPRCGGLAPRGGPVALPRAGALSRGAATARGTAAARRQGEVDARARARYAQIGTCSMRVPSPNYHSPRPVAGLFHFGGMESACALLREAAPLPWTSASHRSRPHHFPGAGVFCQHDLTSPAPAGLFHSAESVSDVQPNRACRLLDRKGMGRDCGGRLQPRESGGAGADTRGPAGRAQLERVDISTLRHSAKPQ
jgi:hypothetical protein